MRLRPTRSTRAELSFPTRCSSDLLSFPAILIAMLVDGVTRSVLGSDKHSEAALTVLIVSLELSYWVQSARTVRGPVLVEKNRDSFQSARVIGLPGTLPAIPHVLPHVMGTVLGTPPINLAPAERPQTT